MTFDNCPLLDFTQAEIVAKFSETLKAEYSRLTSEPFTVPLFINGELLISNELHTSLDPSTDEEIANISYAKPTDVDKAIKHLSEGMQEWRKTPAEQRAACLERAADLFIEERYRITALLVIESGKPWAEADADLAEAVDFCRYYALQMRKLATPQKTMEVLGENSLYFYQPRGIAAVISPWNFPLAIPTGMTVAALVTGNVVALKPAEQTSLIAYELVKTLLKSGIPSSAIAFLPGRGESVGQTLVESPLVDMISFTGSRDVGLQIIQKASVVQENQMSIKKVLAELGGKNAIIVDEDADLDQAIKGVLYSAFGFSGQKCSACSRVIVVGLTYNTFMKRFAKAIGDLIYGSAHDPGIFFGPVIDNQTKNRLLEAIAKAKQEFKVLHCGEVKDKGYIVPPAVFAEVPIDSWLWKNELFGPILAINKAETFEQALDMANDSEYALTGGLFSRSPSNIDKAIADFAVGNLYINRSCTGAIVCRHPFGGFKLSGVGSKAGGPDYLLQFLEPRTVTENTMRSGFTPDLTT